MHFVKNDRYPVQGKRLTSIWLSWKSLLKSQMKYTRPGIREDCL